jgi:hypothetical protein
MSANYLKCDCHFCGKAVRFEVSQVGQLVNCLDCGQETVLYIPGQGPPYLPELFPLVATNIAWSRNPLGLRNIVGIVMNKSNKNLDWVRIEFTLVNQLALPVGSTSDALFNLPAKGTWQFKAPVFQADALGAGAPQLSCEYGKIFCTRPPVVRQVPAPPDTAASSTSPHGDKPRIDTFASPH